MKDTYTRQEAMERMGFKSVNAFLQLERKYPDAFVVMKKGTDKQIRYHKVTIDRFAERHEYFKREKR